MIAPAKALRHETAFAGKPGEAAAVLEPLLLACVTGASLLSTTFDYGPAPGQAEPVGAEAWVERTTRTLTFAHARLVTPEGAVLVTCSAVLKNAAEA
jgi:hypothetical protein